MTGQELQELLSLLRQVNADLLHVEAKAAQGGVPQDLWKTLSAFANTPGGGVILLGVDEARHFEVTGVKEPGKIQADVASLCDRMTPPLRPTIEVHHLEGQLLVTVEVPELPYTEKPCFYTPAGIVNGAYIRVADGDRRLTQYEVQAFIERRQQPRHDAEPVEEASLEELDPELLQRFLRRIRNRRTRRWQDMPDLQVLRTFRVVTEGKTGIVPTLAGYLCFGRYPQERFPGLCATFVRYPTERAGETGPAGERFLDNEKITGPIPVMVADTLRAIKRNMRQREVIRGLLREEFWEYPEAVLREAIVNALGHRDYSPMARGSHVQVQMFPTRLVVLNPGGLFGPVTVEDLGRPGIQASRNPHLMAILEDLPAGENGEALCENRGSGITSMIALLRKAGMQPPVFEDRLTTFQVTFSNASLLDHGTLRWLEWYAGAYPLSESQRLALAYMRYRSYVANSDYCRLTGVDSRVATRELGDLVAKGLARRQGTGRWAVYSLPPGAELPAPPKAPVTLPGELSLQAPRLQPTTEYSRLLGVAREGPARGNPATARVAAVLRSQTEASTREIARLTGLSASSVRLALRALQEAGLVAPTAEPKSPRRRYRWLGVEPPSAE